MKIKEFSTVMRFGAVLLILSFCTSSCNKLVEINPPTNSISTVQVFKDSVDAVSALDGIYTSMANSGYNTWFGNGNLTQFGGASADELLIFASFYTQPGDDIMYNRVQSQPDGNFIEGYFWTPPYQYIYQANAVIEGVNNSKGISASAKSQFIGEALFFRAFLHFYLVNLFGPVPVITTTDYASNAKASRSAVPQVYQSIINDLRTAEDLLVGDYSAGGGERIKANKWAAAALLARAYLYDEKWDSAERSATEIINNTSMFSLDSDLNSVFLKNTSEAILQWNLNVAYPPFNATAEGITLIPYDSTTSPTLYLNQQLLNAFEPGDLRKLDWLGATNYQGVTYYYPDKYKVGPVQSGPGNSATEYYMVLRLAEQYLIRAEARVMQNTNLNGAISDLNAIRERAHLPDLPATLSQSQINSAVMQERRIELFAEWGHRWFDLKRTRTVDSVMTIATPLKGGGSTWQTFQQLYPIPFSQLQKSPNLTQNPGYY